MGRLKGEVYDIMRMRGLSVAGLSIETGMEEEDLNAYIYHGKRIQPWDAERIARALEVGLSLIYESDD